jgi:hypothetical protein
MCAICEVEDHKIQACPHLPRDDGQEVPPEDPYGCGPGDQDWQEYPPDDDFDEDPMDWGGMAGAYARPLPPRR